MADDTTQPALELCDAEQLELQQHPVPSAPSTDEQLRRRQAIAAKVCAHLLRADSTLTTAMRRIYDDYPMWKFYSNAHAPSMVRRAYGVALGTLMVSCRFQWINDVVGGVPCAAAHPLNEWSAEQVCRTVCHSSHMLLSDLHLMRNTRVTRGWFLIIQSYFATSNNPKIAQG